MWIRHLKKYGVVSGQVTTLRDYFPQTNFERIRRIIKHLATCKTNGYYLPFSMKERKHYTKVKTAEKDNSLQKEKENCTDEK